VGRGNAYTFRLRTSTYMQTAMLIPDAAKLNKKRWAIVYPNYEYGQSATAAFKKLLAASSRRRVSSPSRRRRSARSTAGAVAQALADAKPDAIFSSLFGADLAKFVREGQQRGLFKGVEVFNLLGRRARISRSAQGRVARRLVRHGYPWSEIKTAEHTKFLDAYQAKFKDYPRLGSVVGYAVVYSAVEAIRKAGALDQEKLVAAMKASST
jgi:branched-chain amino acid transport system substrate-binding protein